MDDGWKKPMWLLQQIAGYFNNVMTKLDAIQNMFGTSGDADVSPADIRLGKKAYNGTTLVTGTMPENVAVAETINAGEAYVIPQGYHDGTGKVTANSLASQTDGTATAEQILSGKTAYVDGVKVTGSMTNNGSKSAALNAGGSFTIPQGYHDGTGKVTANSLASQTAGTAVAGNILSGKTAWVGGNKVTGSMDNKAGTTVKASAVTQDDNNTYFNVPAAGYYDTNSKVYTENSNLKTFNVVSCALIYQTKVEIPIDITKVTKVAADWGTAKYCYYGECTISNGVITEQISKDLVKNVSNSDYFEFSIEGGKLYIKQGFNNVTYNVGIFYI